MTWNSLTWKYALLFVLITILYQPTTRQFILETEIQFTLWFCEKFDKSVEKCWWKLHYMDKTHTYCIHTCHTHQTQPLVYRTYKQANKCEPCIISLVALEIKGPTRLLLVKLLTIFYWKMMNRILAIQARAHNQLVIPIWLHISHVWKLIIF